MSVAEGPRLYLRPIRLADVTDAYLSWMNDSEVIRFLESRFVAATMESLRAFVGAIESDPAQEMLAIVERLGDRHVGNIKLGPIDHHHDVAEVGLLIGEKDCWRKGYATEAITLVMSYAFGGLKLRRLTAGAYANNVASVRAFEKAGFTVEGRGRQHYRCGDQYVDRVFLGALRADTRGMAAGEKTTSDG